ncbi:MAG: sigma-E processing peptidase SpoIIGA [Eubacterium sp.]|nr:sigma-E processing peptidase SpoIIGA [Eubacterium sp.]
MGSIYEVYIDVLAVNNFLIDLAAFMAVNLFLRRRVRAYRILIGVILGTIGSCLAFLYFKNLAAYLLFVHFVLNPAALSLSFREKNRKAFIEDLLVGYFAFLIIGGAIEWIYKDGRGTIPYGTAAAAAVGMLILAVLWTRRYLKNRSRYYEAAVSSGSTTVRLYALADSGCLLHDPYTGRPVSMIDQKVFEASFGKPQAVRLIPYESLGCRHGLIQAVTVEELHYIYENKERCVKQAVLGLADHQLFEKKAYGMIINPQELAESKILLAEGEKAH